MWSTLKNKGYSTIYLKISRPELGSLILIRQVYMNGRWLTANQRTNTQKTSTQEKILNNVFTIYMLNNQHNSSFLEGGERKLCDILTIYRQKALMIHNNSRSTPRLSKIDRGSFVYICKHTKYSHLACPSRIR